VGWVDKDRVALIIRIVFIVPQVALACIADAKASNKPIAMVARSAWECATLDCHPLVNSTGLQSVFERFVLLQR
jgi:hypothetical protein